MPDKMSRNLALALGASQMGFLVAGGLLGGLWLDQRWQTTPLCGFIGLLAGFISGVVVLIRLVRTNKDGA